MSRRGLTVSAAVVFVALLAASFQIWSLDGLKGAVLSAVLHQDTAYAKGYTDRAFRSIRTGMTDEDVRTTLGSPLVVGWSYKRNPPNGCVLVHFRSDKTISWAFDECQKLGIRVGLPAGEAAVLLGPLSEVSCQYSESPGDTHYRERVVRFSKSRVVEIVSGWYLD